MAFKNFEMFHLSLIAKPADLFGELSKIVDRETWLSKVFTEDFEFIHARKKFHWVAKGSFNRNIFGIVARAVSKSHHAPPEEGASEVTSTEWQGAWVIIDPTHHDDGQKLSFERDERVGKPSAVLTSLLRYANLLEDAPYTIEQKQIFAESVFWEWAEAHNNQVRRINFDFIAPNMWNTANELASELVEARDNLGAQHVKVGFLSKLFVKTNTEKIRQGVEYAARGGGSVKAVALNKDKFDSRNQP